MKIHILLLLLIIFLMDVSLGQQKNLSIPTDENGDTTLWYKLNDDYSKKLALSDLTVDQREKVYRIWYHGQVSSNLIEISKANNEPFTGTIMFYTEEQVDFSEEKPTNRIHFKKIAITTTQAEHITQLILEKNIHSLPSDQDIKGWQQGFDGVTYALENSDPWSYTLKTYWTSSAQKSLKEAETILAFMTELDSLLDLGSSQSTFLQDIPFERYSTGGPTTAIKVYTKKQRRKAKRERDNYRQQDF